MSCPVPLGRDGPSGAGGCPTRRCVPQQRGQAQHLCREVGIAGGLQGPWFCPCDGHTALQLLPCSSWPLGLHGQSSAPFPLTVLMGLIPWVHMLMLEFLLTFEMFYWAFPVLEVFPVRSLSWEAPVNKHISEGTGGFVSTLDLLFPNPPPK